MIIKLCQFPAHRQQGERLVQIFQPGEMEKAAEFFSLGKTAAPMLPQVQQYLERLQPDPAKIYTLVNALGAGEFWGSNINGDYFPESSLIHRGPVYGYETFYGAHPYKHHVNKDPSRSFGKVELACWHNDMKRVELVVVIDRHLARQFAADDVCDKLDQGMFPDVSMGCKVPYDLCSVCTDWAKYRRAQSTYNSAVHQSVGKAVLAFHKKDPIRGVSVTRNDYCEHLKTMLNKILSDGRKVYAINDFPRFFDISFVFIGADKTAKVMAKLAEANPGFGGVAVPSWYVAEQTYQPAVHKEMAKVAAVPGKPLFGAAHPGRAAVENVLTELFPKVNPQAVTKAVQREAISLVTGKEKKAGVAGVRALMREKSASHHKGAEIIKEVVPSQFGSKAVPLDGKTPDLPNDVLDQLGQGDLGPALSTPTSMGIVLKPREFQRITIIRLGDKSLADKLDNQGEVFPPCMETDRSVPMGTDQFSSVLKRILLPFLEDRSYLEPVAKRRVIKISMLPKPEVVEDDEPKVASAEPLLMKISAAYNGYLDRIGECMAHAGQIVEQNPDLWEATFRAGVADGFSKEAAGVNPAVVLGAVGGAALLSRWAKYQRGRAMMGARRPTGILTDLAADHPKTLMVLGGLGALKAQGSPVPDELYGKAKAIAKDVGGALLR